MRSEFLFGKPCPFQPLEKPFSPVAMAEGSPHWAARLRRRLAHKHYPVFSSSGETVRTTIRERA